MLNLLFHRKRAKVVEVSYEKLVADAEALKAKAAAMIDKADKDFTLTTAAIQALTDELGRIATAKTKLAQFDIKL